MIPVQKTNEEEWAELDAAPSPFLWPDDVRLTYMRGVRCTLMGRSTTDMSLEELTLFVGMLDSQVSYLQREKA
jgi:hypothetical protein